MDVGSGVLPSRRLTPRTAGWWARLPAHQPPAQQPWRSPHGGGACVDDPHRKHHDGSRRERRARRGAGQVPPWAAGQASLPDGGADLRHRDRDRAGATNAAAGLAAVQRRPGQAAGSPLRRGRGRLPRRAARARSRWLPHSRGGCRVPRGGRRSRVRRSRDHRRADAPAAVVVATRAPLPLRLFASRSLRRGRVQPAVRPRPADLLLDSRARLLPRWLVAWHLGRLRPGGRLARHALPATAA